MTLHASAADTALCKSYSVVSDAYSRLSEFRHEVFQSFTPLPCFRDSGQSRTRFGHFKASLQIQTLINIPDEKRDISLNLRAFWVCDIV